jgi:hypothetical protein
MLLTRLDVNRCVERDFSSNSPLELQAIQPYPYHPSLGVRTLLNGFAVHPFTDMRLFLESFLIQSYCSSTLRVAPSGKSVGFTGDFSNL